MKNLILSSRFRMNISGLVALLCILAGPSMYAQLQADGTPAANSIMVPHVHDQTPGSYFDTVFDRFGNKFLLGQLATNNAIRKSFNALTSSGLTSSPAAPATHLYTGATCPANYFNIYLEDGCGMDLYASDPTQHARLNVLVQVLCDLSGFIQSPCTTTGQKVNIWVRGGLTTGLGVATPFFNIPYSASNSGIADNTEWLTINSGKDAFAGIAPPVYTSGGGITGSGPGTVYFHGSIAFNFSPGITWNTDPIPSPAPAAGVYDLYSVILHEMMHTLGFCTLIDYNGRSVFDQYNVPPTPATWQYYGRYDQHLETSTSSASTVPLITGSLSGCDMYQFGFNTAAAATPGTILSPELASLCPDGFYSGGETSNTVCSLAIRYAGGTGITTPVYTPACFEKGGSLSHFDDQCYVPTGFPLTPPASNEEYFVMSNAAPSTSLGGYNATTNPGVLKRFPTAEERQVLCDIGYAVGTTYGLPGVLTGTAAATYTGLSGTNLNYHDYGGTACTGRQVVGFNDGITASGASYSFYTTAGTGININAGTAGGSILDNDVQGGVSITTSGGTFSCLQVMTGTGTVSIAGTVYPTVSGNASTVVTYTPGGSDFGVQLLRYVPVSSTGVEGNITYIYVFVGSANCAPSACNIVVNSGFENPATGVWGEYMNGAGASPGYTSATENCWLRYNGFQHLYATDEPWLAYASYPGYFSIPNTYLFKNAYTHPVSAALNNHFLGIESNHLASSVPPWTSTSVQEQLSTPLIAGSQYTISFWALLGGGGTTSSLSGLPTHVQFCVGNTFPLVAVSTDSAFVPAGYTTIAEFNVNATDTQWHQYSQTFTYTGTGALATASALVIQTAPWDDTDVVHTYATWLEEVGIDDISIVPADMGCSFSIPTPVCGTSTPFDLNYIASVGIPGGTFSWPTLPVTSGVAATATTNIFNPADAYNASISTGGVGNIQVGYTYTVSGCVQTVYAEIKVIPGPPITGPATLCNDSSITLSDPLAGGKWASSNTGVATVDSASGVVMGILPGTTIITYNTADTGCTAFLIVTVNPCTTLFTKATTTGNKITVYPNPTLDELHIDGINASTNYRLLNVTGKCVQAAYLQKGSNTISMSGFIPGVYTLEITGPDGIKTRTKVLKE